MRREKPVPVSHCYPVLLPCLSWCPPGSDLKQMPAAILFIVPALASARRRYMLAATLFTAKWNTLML